ncbi:cysteine-rich motor neuron 1 protein-like [Tachysurus ichikawai]
MRSDSVLALLNFCVLLRASAGQVCAPCPNRACIPVPAQGCEEGRVLARDPCGCCDQCTRLDMELCGGENWQLGYCAPGLTCTDLNHTGAVTSPHIGVCKGMISFTSGQTHTWSELVRKQGCQSLDI